MGGKSSSVEIIGLKPLAYPMRRVTALLLGFRPLACLKLAVWGQMDNAKRCDLPAAPISADRDWLQIHVPSALHQASI
jgi:hypothetical protein